VREKCANLNLSGKDGRLQIGINRFNCFLPDNNYLIFFWLPFGRVIQSNSGYRDDRKPGELYQSKGKRPRAPNYG
jgi:hypothetical protein